MEVLLNDSSVLLNLFAADCIERIAADTGWQFAICPAVRDEVKKLRDFDTGEMIALDLTPHIASGLLQVLELSGEKEELIYIEQSVVVDDGEAMSVAIAASRCLALAIDDKQARNHACATFPEMKLWNTPAIFKHWAEVGQIAPDILSRAITMIENRARYFPARSDALAGWWRQAKQVNGGETAK